MPAKPAAPPHPELVALMDAVKERPDDLAARYALADWLAARNDKISTERATFLRLNTDVMAGKPVPSEELNQFGNLITLWSRWAGPLAKESYGGFDRGLQELHTTAAKFLKPAFVNLLPGAHFVHITGVSLDKLRDTHVKRLAALPNLRFVARLTLYKNDYTDDRVSAASLGQLLASPHATGLRHLYVGHPIGNGPARALAGNPALANLRSLWVRADPLRDDGAAEIAASPHLAGLLDLRLVGSNIGDAGADALARSPYLRNLRGLYVGADRSMTNHGKQLLRDVFGERVQLG